VIAVSTSWNADRHVGWAPAVAELVSLGFSAVALDGPAVQADGAQVRRTLREAKGELVALFAPAPRRDDGGVAAAGAMAKGLVAPQADRRARAVAAALAAARAAADAGTARVVLRAGVLPQVDPSLERRLLDRLVREGLSEALLVDVRSAEAAPRDRDRRVEALCRGLFELTRAAPDVEWSIETPSSLGGFARPAEIETVFDELPRRRIAYWHDAGHAARLAAFGVVPAEEWLARLGPRASGVTISDWSPSAADLPPGAGVVDWRAPRPQLTAVVPRVLRLAPSLPAPLLTDALREARSLGL
jgi:sugar phosphate isomerase/epimerase